MALPVVFALAASLVVDALPRTSAAETVSSPLISMPVPTEGAELIGMPAPPWTATDWINTREAMRADGFASNCLSLKLDL